MSQRRMVLWQLVDEDPLSREDLSPRERLFFEWNQRSWKKGLWSARQATFPTGLSHRGARRMLESLERRGVLKRYP